MKKFLCMISAVFFIAGCAKEAAVVNGVVIYEKDVLAGMKEVNKDTIERLGKENIKQNILDGLVERQLLMLKIRDEKYDSSENIQKIWKPYLQDLTYKYFLNTYLPENHPLSKKVLKKEYDERKEMFKTEGQVRARHILIKTGKGGHPDKDAEAKILAVGKELKKDGSNFAELAGKYSECPSAKNGGDLNYFGRGQMVKPFEDAAFSMKKGEVSSKPVKTEFGYHLIYIEDIKDPTYPSLDEVKQYFISDIYLRDLIKEYGIVIYKSTDKESKDYIGAVKKLGLNYSIAMYKEDIEKLMGKDAAAKFLAENKDTSKYSRELLMKKVFDDKIKKYGMDKDKKFLKFTQNSFNELITSTYLEEVIFKNIKVTDAEVQELYRNNYPVELLAQQFGERFKNDASFRRKTENDLIFPELRSKLLDQKKSEIFYNLIESLKNKYKVEYKIKYKTI